VALNTVTLLYISCFLCNCSFDTGGEVTENIQLRKKKRRKERKKERKKERLKKNINKHYRQKRQTNLL
jgi:hypothetical protein